MEPQILVPPCHATVLAIKHQAYDMHRALRNYEFMQKWSHMDRRG